MSSFQGFCKVIFHVISGVIEFDEEVDAEYIMCITDKLIENDAQGLLLAKALHDITGIPLQRISFWHHARDDSLEDYQLSYRKCYMLDLIDKVP